MWQLQVIMVALKALMEMSVKKLNNSLKEAFSMNQKNPVLFFLSH